MTGISLRHVEFVPKDIEAGVLYVSEEYEVAVHLCACGCGSRVSVPLGPAEWAFSERNGRPTLHPSIGSGQLPCNSHYVIRNGEIVWAPRMCAAQTAAAMQADQRRREAYYNARKPKPGRLRRFCDWLLGLIGWQ